MDGIVHATFVKMGEANDEGEVVEDYEVKRYPNATAAMAEAQRHQDQRLLAWLHPQVQIALRPEAKAEAPAPDTAERVAETRRSADRTWSVPEMIDRQSRALANVVEAGESLQQYKQAPSTGGPERQAFELVRDAYNLLAGLHTFTHERVQALDAYLSAMHEIDFSEHPNANRYRDYWGEEYSLGRETYIGQRDRVRDILHLDENDPEVLCLVPAPMEVVSSTLYPDRVMLGCDVDGYRVGLIPEHPESAVLWTDASTDRSEATEKALRIHSNDMEEAMVTGFSP
ncbi:MAG: hypothetical protein ACREPQ_00560 [Rhodanobacter sp.]